MPWFEKLKDFIRIHFHITIAPHIDVHLLNFNINSNNESEKCEYDEGAMTLAINRRQLTIDQEREFRSIIREAVQVDDVPLLDKQSKERIDNIGITEASEDVKSLEDYFKGKIPEEDFRIFRAALFVKKRSEEGPDPDEILSLRREIMQKYGDRGRKITNLCSAGYFETHIKPAYEIMKRIPNTTDKDFLDDYDLFIKEEAFAVFVPSSWSIRELKDAIKRKLERNIRYGRKFVSIHGIGRTTIEKITEVISELKQDYPEAKLTISIKEAIIYAKLWFE
jgi:hypothetical protein